MSHSTTQGCPSQMMRCACHLPPGHLSDPATPNHACDPDECGGQWTDDHTPVLFPGVREDGTRGLTEAEAREAYARAMTNLIVGALYPEDAES